jgi:anti-sigma factor RsiW
MMHEAPTPQPPREWLWRRSLDEAERARLRAWLEAHPEARADWELEIALTEALARLPDAPAPSNFTARVLQAIEREEASRVPLGARDRLRLFWRRWLPRFAVAAAALAAGIFLMHRHEVRQQAEWRRSLTLIAAMPAVPSPQALEDFDVVRHLGRTPPWDEELLALMQ